MKDLNLKLRGMSCASCANSIEKAILNVPGVVQSSVNFSRDSPKERLSAQGKGFCAGRRFANANANEPPFATTPNRLRSISSLKQLLTLATKHRLSPQIWALPTRLSIVNND